MTTYANAINEDPRRAKEFRERLGRAEALQFLGELRAMGIVGATFYVGGELQSVTFAAPQADKTDDKPASTHQRLLKSERDELNELRLERQLAEELGNA